MKIVSVDIIDVKNPLQSAVAKWRPVVVRINTDEGISGFGEVGMAYGVGASAGFGMAKDLSRLLIGEDPMRTEYIWDKMQKKTFWGQGGGTVVSAGMSAIDIALWDIKGKMANMPVYDLFGGKMRAGVPVYRHVDGADVDEICENIEKYRSIGVRHIRCQCGGYGGGGFGPAPEWAAKGAEPGVYLDSKKYMRDTLKLFDGIRAKEGFDINLVHDVHERIHPTEAVTFVKEMEPYKLFFMEDVVPLEQVEWLDKIKQTSVTPLSQGELFNNPAEYKKLVQNRSIDYMRVHLSQVGGITPARKLQMFCEQYGVRICWHGPGDMSPLAHAANIHIDLAAQNLGLQEWSGIEPPNFVIQKLKDNHGALLEVFPGMPEYGGDGFVYANDKPGLGVDLDEKEAAKYPCENTVTTWTQTRNRDGSLQTP